jgi:hypothetical protein
MMDRRGNALLNATGIRSDKDYKEVNKVIDKAQEVMKLDPHTAMTVLQIGTAFIPVVGPFISAGIGLADAAMYYNDGDTKTAGMVAMFSLMPGVGGIVSKIPGVKQLGVKGMSALASKMSKGAKITDPVELAVVNGISKNPDLVKSSLNTQVKSLAQQSTAKQLSSNVKKPLLNLAKSGLNWTAKNVVPYVGAGAGYEYGWNKFNPQQSINLANIDTKTISAANLKASKELQF